MAAVGAVAGTALPLHPSAAEPQAPWHRPFHPQPCPEQGNPRQEQQKYHSRGEICCFLHTTTAVWGFQQGCSW